MIKGVKIFLKLLTDVLVNRYNSVGGEIFEMLAFAFVRYPFTQQTILSDDIFFIELGEFIDPCTCC